jgi:hypothetical protein
MRCTLKVNMLSRAIEIHDSTLDGLSVERRVAVLRFAHAYIHQSEGTPGVAPGTGWSQ